VTKYSRSRASWSRLGLLLFVAELVLIAIVLVVAILARTGTLS
jgi:hypothetical protein